MVNLAFLLLIFLLLSATLAPPAPFPVTPPVGGTGENVPPGPPLLLSATGELAWGEVRGEAVFAALAAASPAPGPLVLRADRAADARGLARLLARLAALGRGEVALVLVEK